MKIGASIFKLGGYDASLKRNSVYHKKTWWEMPMLESLKEKRLANTQTLINTWNKKNNMVSETIWITNIDEYTHIHMKKYRWFVLLVSINKRKPDK